MEKAVKNFLKIALIFILSSETLVLNAQNNYVLYDISENSAVVKNLSMRLDSSNNIDLLNSVFKPIKGKYKTYRFLETYFGESPFFLPDSSVIILLHDVLILVVDKKNRIVDGYQYSIEYPEHPSSCDLYRLYNRSKIKFSSNFRLSSLKFEFVNDPEYCGRDKFLYLSQLLQIQN